jgi:predicted lysophospholipase L1 biosynthesis ABC-type transport system permease subunit
MKILRVIGTAICFVIGFLFAWMVVQAGFEVLPQCTSFGEVIKTLIGMAALLAYGGLANWAGCKIWRLE